MKFYLLYLSLLVTLVASSQSQDRYVISNSGGTGKINVYTLEYTIGETMSATLTNNLFKLAQGFQQPTSFFWQNAAKLTGEITTDGVVLKWNTLFENNSSTFVVERARDTLGIFDSLTSISTHAVNGNSNTPLNYSSTDEQPLSEITYYRIKLIAKDITVTYSNIIAVASKYQIWLLDYTYPNPVKTSFRLHLYAEQNIKSSLILFDELGRVIRTDILNFNRGYNNNEISITSLPNGIYFMKLHSIGGEAKDIVAKIIKI